MTMIYITNYSNISPPGPPLAPFNLQIDPGPREALIRWNEPFSLIEILDYSVILVSLDTDATVTFIVEGRSIQVNETHLLPFRNYRVIVSARNRAGVSDVDTKEFQTDQAGKLGTNEQFNEINKQTDGWMKQMNEWMDG